MDYISVEVNCDQELAEILIATLFDVGFDSFQEEEDGSFIASIPKENFQEAEVKEALALFPDVTYRIQEESKVNWNEEWEKNYDPIAIGDRCLVRATFHQPDPSKEYEIVIIPKMSFGTGHHDTTYQVLAYEMDIDFQDKNVLDVGCGTGVLSIMAMKRGARRITATDIDDWCIENSEENFGLNGITSHYRLVQGQIDLVEDKDFDVILANINKNVLLDQIKAYSERLKVGGQLILSGFYKEDIPDLEAEARACHLQKITSTSRNTWAMLALKKVSA